MLRFVAQRVLLALPSLLGVLVICFVLTRLSGDPTELFLPVDATDEARAAFRAANNLDSSMPAQFVTFAGQVLQGDLGTSLRFRTPATQLLAERLGATLELALVTLAVAVAVGIPAGIWAAVRRGRPADTAIRGLATFGQAVPTFYWAILAILVFSVWLGWLPSGGRDGPASLVLPATTLATLLISLIARTTRNCMLEALRQDFVRTARAKGLRESLVVCRHALRHAMPAVMTVIALQFGMLMGGVIVTETVFSWPGVGRLALQAIYARDYPVVQVVVLFFAVVFVLANLLADLAQAWIDPRVRL